MRLAILLVILAVVYVSVNYHGGGSFKDLPGRRLAPEEPIQKKLFSSRTVQIKDFDVRLTHNFNFKALVLSKKIYMSDAEAKLSPIDLALGWGPMSNPNPLSMIRISQRNRFYYFRYDHAPPIRHRQIELNSANMHMIPANDNVLKQLKSLKKGDVVQIEGFLADVTRNDGWKWKSSTSRSDTGFGACELVYVERINILRPSAS